MISMKRPNRDFGRNRLNMVRLICAQPAHANPARVAPIDKFSVVLTIAFSFVILGEAVTAKTVIGGILIAAGTFVLIL